LKLLNAAKISWIYTTKINIEMQQDDIRSLLSPLVSIAKSAGAAIMRCYRDSNSDVQLKADQSPVTAADLAAHQVLADRLPQLVSGYPVVSEEDVPSQAERRGHGCFWLVDPLDGTKEFVSRNGEFTVNIALIDGHRPVLGVVHIPVADITYAGIPGVGAWREANERARLRIGVRPSAAQPLRVLGSRSHGSSALGAKLAAMGPHELRPVGSSIKLCVVAEGNADFYPRLGPTSEWDIAAGQAVLEAAGGQVVHAQSGLPLRYNDKPDLLNPDFLAYGDPQCFKRWQQAPKA
jgi:3'(2'), 5'-bisphosphate nucleotidase